VSQRRLPIRVLYFGWKRARWAELLTAAEEIELEVISIWLKRDRGRLLAGKIGRAIRSALVRPPDVILAESIGVNGMLPLVLATLTRRPLAVRLTGDPWQSALDLAAAPPLRVRLARVVNLVATRVLLVRADRFLPISDAIGRAIVGHGGDPARCHTAPIEAPVVASTEATDRPGPPRLLTVTNFGFWPKVAPLVEAVATIWPVLERLDLRWSILGDGWALDRAREMLAPFATRVTLPGRQEVAPYYAERPIVVYVSGLDGLPNVVLEAAAHGLPIVVNHDSPATEFIVDGGNGLVVDFADPTAASDALTTLVGDPAARRRLGDEARRWAVERYAPARVRARLVSILCGAAGDSGAPSV